MSEEHDEMKAKLNDDPAAYGPDQLRPVVTPLCNTILRGPEGTEVGDLACYLAVDSSGEKDLVINASFWQPDERQVEMLNAGAVMRLMAWAHPIPPLALAVQAPFCEEDDEQCIWVANEKAFRCPLCAKRYGGDPPDVETAYDQVRRSFTPVEDPDSSSD